MINVNKKIIFGGFIGVGKTTLEKDIRNVYGDEALSVYDESFFVENAQNGDNVDFPGIAIDLFDNLKEGQWSDSCLHTLLITESFVFKKSPYYFLQIYNRLFNHYIKVPQEVKDEYVIIVLRKNWLTVKENIYTRNRNHEIEMLSNGTLTKETYDIFYNQITEMYKTLGFKNVNIINTESNTNDMLERVHEVILKYI